MRHDCFGQAPISTALWATSGICGVPYIEPRNERRHFCLFVGRGRIAISYRPAAGSSLSLPLPPPSLSPSLTLPRFHPRRTIVLLIFQSCAEKERVAGLPRPTAASFFHWPRLVQWLHRSLYRRRDRRGGYRSKLLQFKVEAHFFFYQPEAGLYPLTGG